MKNIDFTPIIEALIALLSAVITLVILPKVKTYLAAKLSAEQTENLKQWVKVAVAAAEQMYNGSGLGQDKYRYVVSFLEEKGIYVNYKEVEALIESEVYKLTQGSGYFVAVPEGRTDVPENNICNTEPAEVLDEYCGDGNGLSEDTEPSVPDETAEAVG